MFALALTPDSALILSLIVTAVQNVNSLHPIPLQVHHRNEYTDR